MFLEWINLHWLPYCLLKLLSPIVSTFSVYICILNNIYIYILHICWTTYVVGHPVVPSSLGPHGWHHTMLPCPSLFPGVCSNLCALNQWHIFKLFPPNLKLRPGKSNGAVRTVEGEEIRKCLGIQVPSPHFRVCSLGAFFRVAFRQVLTCMTGTGCRSHK